MFYAPSAGSSKPRRKRRTKEVAGPYKSQSSVPKIRHSAVPSEHVHVVSPPAVSARPAPFGPARLPTHLPPAPAAPSLAAVLGNLSRPTDPATAFDMARFHGIEPDPKYRRDWGSQTFDQIVKAARGKVASGENLGEPEDLTNAILAVSGAGDVASLLRGAGELGAKEIAGASAGAVAKQAAGTAESTSVLRALAGVADRGAARRGALRSAAGRAATKAEPDAVTALRQSAAKKVGTALEKAPAPVRVGAKVGGRALSAPVKHPFTAPLAIQTPAALLHGDPSQYLKALEGNGTLASITGAGADVLSHGGVVGKVAGEALNLPATVLPSTYLAGKAGVNAAQGNDAELKKLVHQYVDSGVLPAIFLKHDPKAVLDALHNHPLYSLLEGSGAVSVLGRGAGAAARVATGDRIGGLVRPHQTIEGYSNVTVDRGGYSRDLIRQGVQRLHDRRTGSVITGDTRRGRRKTEKVLKQAADRFQSSQGESVRRLHRRAVLKATQDLLPKKKVFGFNRLDRASGNVVDHAIERIIQNPETFSEDLHSYRRRLDAVYHDGHLDKAEAKANRALAKMVEAGIKRASPEDVVNAADAFIAAHKPIVDELVERGVLDAHQAAKAAHISFARIHMGAEHGVPTAPIAKLEADLEAAKPRLREEGKAALSGHHESRQVAADRVRYAESGRVQAERTVATLRANLKRDLDKATSQTGHDRVLAKLERARATAEEARKRLGQARMELRETTSDLHKEGTKVSAKNSAELKRITKEIQNAKSADPQLLDKHGNPLSLAQITAEMQSRGIEPAGFISHRRVSNADYYRPGYPERASLPRGVRTGQSALEGTHLGGIEAVTRQLLRSRGLLDAVKFFDGFITRFGKTVDFRKAGLEENMHDAQRVIADPARYGLNPDIKWQAVRRHPFTAMKREIEGALEHQDPTEASEGFLHEALGGAIAGPGPDGPIAFMPKTVVEQMEKQVQPMGTAMKRVQAATTGFKRAVLPFSPSFYYGNFLDNTIRTALAGITPAHGLVGLHVARELSPELKSQLLSGAHYSSVEKLAAHRSAEAMFRGERAWEVGARAVARWHGKPGLKTLTGAVSGTSKALLGLNAFLTETLPQYGALGKLALADFRETQGSWVRALSHQDELAKEFAKGVKNPDTLIRVQKDIEQVYGNWSHMGPEARKFWSNVAPFWTWMHAAYAFVYVTLPAHHPIQTAMLTAISRMTEPERQNLGLNKQGKEPLPEWLQGGLPLSGGIAPWGKYNSFGYAGNPTEAVNRLLLPQIRGTIEALGGKNWKGEEIPGGEGGRAIAALEALAGSFVPGWNLFTEEGEDGHRTLGLPSGHKYSPLRAYPRSYTGYLREPKKQITVPATSGSSGSGSTSGVDMGSVFGGSATSGVDMGPVFSGR